MNVLVTGGCGFIGSHFIDLLLKSDRIDHVVNIDKLTYAGVHTKKFIPFLDEANPKFVSYAPMGIENNFIAAILRSHKIDVVVNFAAETHVDRSIRYPKAFLETDVMGVFNLAYACLKGHKVRKFIHISTDEVYGPCPTGRESFGEGEYLNPTSPYSASKAAADLLLMSYHKTYGLPVVIVRPCNNYGPRQYPEKLIPLAIGKLMKGEKIPIHGEGKEIREWIYVGDCVQAIAAVMMRGPVGEIYNIGTGQRCSNRYVALAIATCMRSRLTSSVYEESVIEYVPNRPGNDCRYAIDSTKFTQHYWSEESTVWMDFEEGVADTVEWYKTHPDIYDGVNTDSNVYDGEYLR